MRTERSPDLFKDIFELNSFGMNSDFNNKQQPKVGQNSARKSDTGSAEPKRDFDDIEVYRSHIVFGQRLTAADRELARELVNLRIAWARSSHSKGNC